MSKTERIAALNDLARAEAANFQLSAGVLALPFNEQWRVREKVRSFDAWSEADDPYGERSGGSFEHDHVRYAWKVHYYADGEPMRLPGRYNDPGDASRSQRVVSLRLASERALRRVRVSTEPSARKERVWLKVVSEAGERVFIKNIARIDAIHERNKWLERNSDDYDEVIGVPMRMSTNPPAAAAVS